MGLLRPCEARPWAMASRAIAEEREHMRAHGMHVAHAVSCTRGGITGRVLIPQRAVCIPAPICAVAARVFAVCAVPLPLIHSPICTCIQLFCTISVLIRVRDCSLNTVTERLSVRMCAWGPACTRVGLHGGCGSVAVGCVKLCGAVLPVAHGYAVRMHACMHACATRAGARTRTTRASHYYPSAPVAALPIMHCAASCRIAGRCHA